MTRNALYRTVAVALLSALFALLLSAALVAQKAADKEEKPKITITAVPTAAPSEALAEKDITGTVSGAPKGSKIVFWALGDRWYIQCWSDKPLHSYAADGKWHSETHGGYEFVAYLVKPKYAVPASPADSIPTEVGGDILAISKHVTPKK